MYKQAIVNNLIKLASKNDIDDLLASLRNTTREEDNTYDYNSLVDIANGLVRGQEDVANFANEQIYGLSDDFDNLDKVNAENSRNVTSNANVARALANKGLKTYQYAGAGVGGVAGAGLGYAGSNWLSNKLGLKGQRGWRRAGDIALRTLGTAGGAALGGYGGYRLGDYVGNKLFSIDNIKKVKPRGTYTYAGGDKPLGVGVGYSKELLDEMRRAGLDNPVEYNSDVFHQIG